MQESLVRYQRFNFRNIFKGYAMDKNTGKVRLSKIWAIHPRYNRFPKPSHPICHVRKLLTAMIHFLYQ